MKRTVEWNAPGPGPWQQDSAHNPVAQTLLMQRVYPDGFNRGFAETFAAYGVLLDRLAMGVVNGFTYHQPQPFDLPGPDGPKDPAWIGAEFGRRVGVAAEAFEKRIWRDAIAEWDGVDKPAAIARHRELDVDVSALDDAQLLVHIEACAAHVTSMVYQHHRYNSHALVPVGDFLINALRWTGQPLPALLAVFDGYSPVSNVVAPEMEPALTAIRRDADAQKMLSGAGDAADVLARLRARVPEVGEYVDAVHFRVMDGFDLSNPTIGERPQAIVGRLACALHVDTNQAMRRSAGPLPHCERWCRPRTDPPSTAFSKKLDSSIASVTSEGSTARSPQSVCSDSPCSSSADGSSTRAGSRKQTTCSMLTLTSFGL